jgi:hypothetical protein
MALRTKIQEASATAAITVAADQRPTFTMIDIKSKCLVKYFVFYFAGYKDREGAWIRLVIDGQEKIFSGTTTEVTTAFVEYFGGIIGSSNENVDLIFDKRSSASGSMSYKCTIKLKAPIQSSLLLEFKNTDPYVYSGNVYNQSMSVNCMYFEEVV